MCLLKETIKFQTSTALLFYLLTEIILKQNQYKIFL